MPNANKMKFLGLDDFEVSSGYAEFKIECCNCKKVQEVKGFYPNVNIKKEVVAKMTCSDCHKVEPEAPKKKKLSCKIYGLDMHSHWMDEAGLSKNTKRNMTYLASPLIIGYRAKKSLRDFMESQEYDDAQHACDVASGEYPRLLASTAKGLFVASDIIEAGNFECYLSPSNVEVPPEYFKVEQRFYAKDRQGNEFSVSLKQVEDYFSLISSEAV